MSRTIRALLRFASDFAIGVHAGHGIRHGVPERDARRAGRAAERRAAVAWTASSRPESGRRGVQAAGPGPAPVGGRIV
ncbi:hypothetical protein ABZV91_28395 [Nocardia sp. NPDC004568]|uniref:hypothetical protein n=1 Tax=Nocardia sp. NPDC004568 TaxID=3154551 RepID=UPI0033A9C1D1